jgi:phage shock protein PspC (stress-responsive transcriptional regulator)
MNTTVNVNLARQHFYFDQASKVKLEVYFEEIKSYLTDDSFLEELMTDVEARIAELLNEIIVDSQQVVTIQHIGKVIEVMGEPNSFKIDDEKAQNKAETKAVRKLFRDPDDRFLGGVASGVSHYFSLQVKWVRLIWLLLGLFSWGGFSILYIALWIFVPLAKTTSEKFMMKGQAINLSNLEKKIKDEFEEVANQIKNTDYLKAKRKLKSNTARFFNAAAEILVSIFHLLLKFLGIVMVISASVSLFIIFTLMFSIGLYEVFDIALGTPYWPPIDIIHTGVSLWQTAFVGLVLGAVPIVYVFLIGRFFITKTSIGGTATHLILLGVWWFAVLLTIFLSFRFADGVVNFL